MKEIKTDAEGNPVWQERFWWKVEELWCDLVEAFEDIWVGLVAILTNPLWWALLGMSGLLGLLINLLTGRL